MRAIRKKEPLTPERIELTAFEVIEREGLENFSTRKLAEELGCQAMSIYHHFPSKAHLMDALVDRLIGRMDLAADDLPWRERFHQVILEWRKLALGSPAFFRFLALHRLNTAGGLRLLDHMVAIYFDAGLDAETAARLFRTMGYYLTGSLLDETAGYGKGPSAVEPPSNEDIARQYPRIAAVGPYFQANEFEKTFWVGFDIMAEGMERALAERAGGPGRKQS